jgi:hypothetical protein
VFGLFMLLGWVATAALITILWARRRPGRSIVPGLLLGVVSGLLWPVTLWIQSACGGISAAGRPLARVPPLTRLESC